MYVDPKDMELDAPRWTREGFTKALEGKDLSTDGYGDHTEALFDGFSDELAWDQGGHVIQGEWLTVAIVRTESGDTFLFHQPGRMRKRDMAAEFFLENPEYHQSPENFYFEEFKYYNLKP